MELPKVTDVPRQVAEAALQELINTKHLYQFLHIDFTKAVLREAVEQTAYAARDGKKKSTEELIPKLCAEMALIPWALGKSKPNAITVTMPPVATSCGVCKDVEAFGLRQSHEFIQTYDGWNPGEQVFCFELLCQRCKEHVIVFSVKKTRDKLQVVGRSEFEQVPVPEATPKLVRPFYSQAVIAYHAGHYLGAISVLRAVIEQHMRSVVPKSKTMKADAVCDAYMASLPDDFKNRFPSLKEIYGKLSEAIHQANASDEIFEGRRAQIDKHFNALQIFELHKS